MRDAVGIAPFMEFIRDELDGKFLAKKNQRREESASAKASEEHKCIGATWETGWEAEMDH
jgi:hypothetical protein